jgi:hypothetical protein
MDDVNDADQEEDELVSRDEGAQTSGMPPRNFSLGNTQINGIKKTGAIQKMCRMLLYPVSYGVPSVDHCCKIYWLF